MSHVIGGLFDWAKFTDSVRLAVRAGMRPLNSRPKGPHQWWRARRRLGVRVCGFHSALIRMGIPYSLSASLAVEVSEVLTFTAHRASADLAVERGAFPMYAESRWVDEAWVLRKAKHRAGVIPPEDWMRIVFDATTTGVRNTSGGLLAKHRERRSPADKWLPERAYPCNEVQCTY